MNSLSDIKKVNDKSIYKGHRAMRIYRIMPPSKGGRRPTETLMIFNELMAYNGIIKNCISSICADIRSQVKDAKRRNKVNSCFVSTLLCCIVFSPTWNMLECDVKMFLCCICCYTCCYTYSIEVMFTSNHHGKVIVRDCLEATHLVPVWHDAACSVCCLTRSICWLTCCLKWLFHLFSALFAKHPPSQSFRM